MSEPAPRPGPPRKSPLGEKRTAANFKLDATTKRRLKEMAQDREISQADLITELVTVAYSTPKTKKEPE